MCVRVCTHYGRNSHTVNNSCLFFFLLFFLFFFLFRKRNQNDRRHCNGTLNSFDVRVRDKRMGSVFDFVYAVIFV